MNHKQYLTLSAILFSVISFAHLVRILFVLPIEVNGIEVPLWVSGAAVILAGYLATRGFMAAAKM